MFAPCRRLLALLDFAGWPRTLHARLALRRPLGTRAARPLLRATLLLLSRLALRALAVTLALPLPLASGTLRLSLPLLHLPSRPLLELAELAVHEPRRLAVELEACLVVPAIGAALPSLGIVLLTGGAKDAFRERHRETGAHCTLRAVDESRRRTLETLIELATENSASACWDDRRAIELLRRESTAEELRELGAGDQLIAHIFAEQHGG